MTTIPFALSTYQRDRAFVPPQTLVNLIVEKDASASTPAQVMLLQRPGLERMATVPGPVQALFATAGGAAGTYAIASDALYAIDDGATTLIGEMSGTASLSRITSNFDRLAIVNGPLVYLYGATATSTINTFRNIPIPDGYLAADVTTLDAYFIVAMEDGTFFWLVPGDDAFDPLNFATAESDPMGWSLARSSTATSSCSARARSKSGRRPGRPMPHSRGYRVNPISADASPEIA